MCYLLTIVQGLLRLELDKATYERAGLQGTPMRDGGLKHKDNRYGEESSVTIAGSRLNSTSH